MYKNEITFYCMYSLQVLNKETKLVLYLLKVTLTRCLWRDGNSHRKIKKCS